MSKIGLDDLLLFGSIRPLGRRKKKEVGALSVLRS